MRWSSSPSPRSNSTARISATGVDIVCGTGVALAVARRLAATGRPVVVTPCVWTGLAEHHVAFGGTVTLEFAAFAAVLRGVVRSAVRAGFKRVMLLNGHGGNAEAVAVVGGECQNEFGIARRRRHLLAPGRRRLRARSWNASRP